MKLEAHPPRFLHYHAGKWEPLGREVIVETPVSLTVNGQAWLTFMCTPTDLESLAVGFLFNEGVIKSRDELELVQVCKSKDNVDVWLKHPVEQPQQWRRTSGCTGGKTAVAIDLARPDLQDGITLAPQLVNHWIEELSGAQQLYRQVGGVHTSILSDGKRVVVSAEDVGRHNSMDKIAGRCLLDGIDLPSKIIITTGRISSEMIQKAARIGASIVISRTSASSLSISLAEKWDITLIGYARREQFVVYTHSERILQHSEGLFEYKPPKEAQKQSIY
ncbi:MAG: formate dehydrogenase accessory sulfurtransferase FdhD [Chloroflexi bacterium]|nr:formate dehydrogenase accessory sulfurtransferase FdhD [Chloroflexota bacterium]